MRDVKVVAIDHSTGRCPRCGTEYSDLARDLERDHRATGSTRASLYRAHDTEADREERTSGY